MSTLLTLNYRIVNNLVIPSIEWKMNNRMYKANGHNLSAEKVTWKSYHITLGSFFLSTDRFLQRRVSAW